MNKRKNAAPVHAFCATILSSLGWSVVFLLLYRVPIPFAGYTGPYGDIVLQTFPELLYSIITLPVAWILYSMLGGGAFHALIICIAIFVGKMYQYKKDPIVLTAAFLSFFPVLGISILDKIIGPW